MICVDDGSTDESSKMIRDYAAKDVRFHLIQKKNGGPSSARNLGLKAACGEWIMFADSDDYYIQENIWLIGQVFNNCSNELVVFPYREGNAAIRGVCEDGTLSLKNFLSRGYQEDPFYVNALFNKVYRKDILDQIEGFDENVHLGEDALFNSKYFSKISRDKTTAIKVCNRPVYAYQMNDSSLSHSTKSMGELLKSYSMIGAAAREILNQVGLHELGCRVYQTYYFGIVNEYLKRKESSSDDEYTILELLEKRQYISEMKYSYCGGKFGRLLLFLLKTNHVKLAKCLIDGKKRFHK